MDEQTFWKRVAKQTGGCWVWQGYCHKERGGYGIVSYKGRTWRAHRLAWELENGPIPEKLYILHSCDNPPCVNPAHLRAGTQAENMQDRTLRGKPPVGQPAGESHALAKLTDAEVKQIHQRRCKGASIKSLATEYNVSRTTIDLIAAGKTWKNLKLTPIPRSRGSKRYGAKLTETSVQKIRQLAADGVPRKDLVRRFGVGRTTIHDIINRKKWTHVP